MMKKILFTLLAAMLLLTGCTMQKEAQERRILDTAERIWITVADKDGVSIDLENNREYYLCYDQEEVLIPENFCEGDIVEILEVTEEKVIFRIRSTFKFDISSKEFNKLENPEE